MKDLDKSIKRKYTLSEYDPEWVVKFESIKNKVSDVFGSKVLSIEHVGSTSIPGMMAKPVIDVLVVVKDTKTLEGEIQKMVALGYEWGDNYIAPNTLIFFKEGNVGEKLENIHVCEKDAPKVRQFLVMREYFRAHPDKAKEYSDLKEKNFSLYPDDYPAYRAAKQSFLERMEKEAYVWEEKNNLD